MHGAGRVAGRDTLAQARECTYKEKGAQESSYQGGAGMQQTRGTRSMDASTTLLARTDRCRLPQLYLSFTQQRASEPARPAVICKYYYYTCALEDAYCGFACTIIILVREG
jgi:hypothetical protein